MAEAANVRLVRCPKCENLLPELPDFSLYRCGGCGAVLKAKKKGVPEDGLSEVSDDGKGLGISEGIGVVNVTEVDMERTDENESSRAQRNPNEIRASNGSSGPQAENEAVQIDGNASRRGKERIRRLDGFGDEYGSYSHGPVRVRNQGKNFDLNVDRSDYVNFREEIRHPVEPLRSRPLMDQWGSKSNGSLASSGPASSLASQGRNGNFLYHDEGSSSYGYYQHGERTRYPRRDSSENLENGRIELLRKLDELKDQLSRSCDVADGPHERLDTNRNMVPPNGRYHGLNKQPLPHDLLEAPYRSQPHGLTPYTDRYDRESYPGYSHDYPGNPDPYHPEILRRPPPHQPQSHYMRGPYHGRYYGDVPHDLVMLHPHENFFHQPACSCVHCYGKNWHLPPKVELHNRRSQDGPSSHNFHHHLNPILQGPPPVYGSGGHSRQSMPVSMSDLESENNSFNYHRPRKIVLAHKSGRVWYPIAGGAPFITCSNCFELLKLPRKRILLGKKEQKMKCGACSSIILFELGSKGFTVSVSARVDQGQPETDGGSWGTGDKNATYWHGGSDTNAYSNDGDDAQPKFSPADKRSDSGESEKQSAPLSPASTPSEDEEIPEKVPSEKHVSPPVELPMVEVKSLPNPDLSSQDRSDNIMASRFETGNKSKRSDRARSRQNSIKDAAMATELDVSRNEFSNSCVSQDSVDISKEDQPKINKGGESFFAGLIKKSFRDFKKSNQSVEDSGSQVYVNGHFIPDRVVKKAEKLAGPIQPGEYWYDNRAGFWGVMGHPCLGIIMPNIEEFDYPMPEKCAAGNTGVFVNGRELHQKDLDLLVSRGLPVSKHRSYIIDISGKVVDEDTGEELDGLGKLAPTVERANHGFGMKVPRFIAQLQN